MGEQAAAMLPSHLDRRTTRKNVSQPSGWKNNTRQWFQAIWIEEQHAYMFPAILMGEQHAAMFPNYLGEKQNMRKCIPAIRMEEKHMEMCPSHLDGRTTRGNVFQKSWGENNMRQCFLAIWEKNNMGKCFPVIWMEEPYAEIYPSYVSGRKLRGYVSQPSWWEKNRR